MGPDDIERIQKERRARFEQPCARCDLERVMIILEKNDEPLCAWCYIEELDRLKKVWNNTNLQVNG